jgi:regulatory protein
MKVTDIKQQVKRQGRYSIYVDEKYSFSLSENELMQSGIRIGREYEAAELEKLLQTAVLDKAFMRSLDYLARRPRSEWEVRDYLKRKEYDPPTVDTILNKLSDYGYIDDVKFSQAWVNNRRLLKPTSLRKLRQELMQKHVSQDVIAQVLDDEGEQEHSALKQLIQKKQSQTRYQDKQKLMAYLMRQGFNYGDVKQALEDTNED